MMKPALDVNHLTVTYGSVTVLWNISLQIPQGVIVGILGPNGAGKTTFLNSCLGLLPPLSGSIQFFGHPLKEMYQRVAYVPQRQSVDWDFPITVKELVLMGRYGKLGLFKRPRPADYEAAEHFLSVVGMENYQHRQINQLSGGQKQRIFLARALLQEADIYFMDEPFAGVDAATESVLMDVLKELRNSGKTIFVVHHDLQTVEKYFDWLILLNLRLIGFGPREEMFVPSFLNATYGKSDQLFDEVLRLKEQQVRGELI